MSSAVGCGAITPEASVGPGDIPLKAHLAHLARDVLTGDQKVTYPDLEMEDDRVFKALADQSRRLLLDRLFERDGRTLSDLEGQLDMTRFGVMKHLRVLEEAGLVVSLKKGREKLHYLNPIPIRQIHDRWISKYQEREVSALLDLKNTLEVTG